MEGVSGYYFLIFFRLLLPALSARFSHYVSLIYSALLVCSLLAIVIFILFSEATISAELLWNSVFLASTFETLYWTCWQLLFSSAPACLLGFQKQLLTISWYFLINKRCSHSFNFLGVLALASVLVTADLRATGPKPGLPQRATVPIFSTRVQSIFSYVIELFIIYGQNWLLGNVNILLIVCIMRAYVPRHVW